MNTLGTLLSELIDYAGLFPPASLTMREAVGNYASYLHGAEHWALGRFVVPATRLPEFYDELRAAPQKLTKAWRLSLLGTPEEAWRVCDANPADNALTTIDALEVKVNSAREIESSAKRVPEGMTAYFEIPRGRDLAESIAACSAMGVRVKLRTGGVATSMIPRAEELAHALVLCNKTKTPFKATAGLHHPLRSLRRLTDAPDSPTGTVHGFLNVFLAAALLWSGGSESDAAVTLRRDSPETFDFGENQVHWHAYTLSENQLRAAREEFAISFESCSFEEPIENLKSLSWL